MRDMIQMYISLYVKYWSFLSDFNESSIFLAVFLKITQIPNFMIIDPFGAELFHADGRTGGQTHDTRADFFFFSEDT